MNERIKELAKQAEKLADIESKAFTDNTGKWRLIWNEVYDKNFAQLIVREYGNIVLHYTDVDEGVKVANKHFGVEE